jgi:hypothetical protein
VSREFYKIIFKSKKLRLSILSAFRFIPDRIMIFFQYYIKVGRFLSFSNPSTYSEKLQSYKLFYRNDTMTNCVDKYLVRGYVANKVGEKYLTDLYQVVSRGSALNYSLLPSSFVIKSTNGCGAVIICKEFNSSKEADFNNIISEWWDNPTAHAGREWAYYNVVERLVIEELLLPGSGSLNDYKFYCFNGKVSHVLICADRVSQSEARKGFFDPEFRFVDVGNPIFDFGGNISDGDLYSERPENYIEMIQVAEKLAEDFPHVRVDLYNVDGRIVFGEMTFYSGSGYRNYGKLEKVFLEKFNF